MAQNDRDERATARLALMVLRSVGGGNGSPRTTRVVLQGRELSEAEAVAVLSKMPKPVRCSASEKNGRLEVECRVIESREMVKVQEEHRQSNLKYWLDRERNPSSSPEQNLLVRGNGEENLFSVKTVADYSAQYRIFCTLAMFPPSQSTRAKGAIGVIELRPSGHAEVRDVG